MKDFLLVFRRDVKEDIEQMSPEQMQAWMKLWMDWLGGLGAQNKLTSPGNRLASNGQVLRGNNVVTNGPYVEIKEALGGYSIIKAETIEEATELAKGCPILTVGGSVEIRPIEGM